MEFVKQNDEKHLTETEGQDTLMIEEISQKWDIKGEGL